MKIAVTTGDPAGVGPDVAAMLACARAERPCTNQVIIVGDPAVIGERAEALGIADELEDSLAPRTHTTLLEIAADAPVTAGVADPRNAGYVLAQIDAGVAGCRNRSFDALVTSPVNKAAVIEAGNAFSGHTEYLAAACNCDTVMMLVHGRLRVALATTHLPLAAVPRALTRERLKRTLCIVDADLRRLFGVADPRIAVCGLNPHAGESGHLGEEERQVIRPVVSELSATMQVTGPLPADTAFIPRRLSRCDAVVAMYHDQGLPVVKHAGFDDAVNVTLGLPFVRTSVDHGTALELAATGEASPANLAAAVACAGTLAENAARWEKAP